MQNGRANEPKRKIMASTVRIVRLAPLYLPLYLLTIDLTPELSPERE